MVVQKDFPNQLTDQVGSSCPILEKHNPELEDIHHVRHARRHYGDTAFEMLQGGI